MRRRLRIAGALAMLLAIVVAVGGSDASARRPRPLTFRSGIVTVKDPSVVTVNLLNTATVDRTVTLTARDAAGTLVTPAGGSAEVTLAANQRESVYYQCGTGLFAACELQFQAVGLRGIVPSLNYVPVGGTAQELLPPGGWLNK